MPGIRHVLRNFTATAVKEHLRSQLEDTGGAPNLTDKEVELVRYIRDESVKLDVVVAQRTGDRVSAERPGPDRRA